MSMYAVVVGGGKVGLNLARELMQKGHEVTLVEKSRARYTLLEPQLEHVVHYGDGTELWVLERAGIERADMVIAVTGDDEDNIIISQVAKEKYGKDRIIARANNIRNLQHFELLGISPVVSSTDLILRLIEHEVPQYGLVHLLTLQAEGLEIIEVEVSAGSPAVGKTVGGLDLPDGSLLISVLRERAGFVPRVDTVIEAGDEVLLVLNPGIEQDITRIFTLPEESFA
jgi:trk system potassium uptake protein TrkA